MKNINKKVTSKLTLGSSDIVLLSELALRIDKFAGKFKYTDITRDNLSFVAYECTLLAKQFIRGHVFKDLKTGKNYELSYMSVKVSNVNFSVDIIPMFSEINIKGLLQ